jgi:aryl-phospho-beta-D-glucosidase BglC (GH1 family)
VLLDRPGRTHRFVVNNIRAVPADQGDSEALFATEFFQTLEPTLGRGVNLGNALEAPNEGEWGVRLDEKYFDLLQQAGFNSVRIPVRWSAHAAHSAPFRIDETFQARVDWAIRQALARRLYVVVNIHHYEEIMRDPRAQRERFLGLWRQIAEQYRDSPTALYFELLNEPHAELKADVWNDMLADAIAVIRKSNPTRKIVVGPAGWNSISQLDNLELPKNDRNLIVTFHYYSPFQFTHQGASWVGSQSQQWLGTRWLGTPAEKQAVVRDLDRALRWGVENRRPLFLGEFGAYSKADLDSRARWTRFLADESLKRKIGFAYWEFCSGFGVYDSKANRWVEPLKDALVPAAR